MLFAHIDGLTSNDAFSRLSSSAIDTVHELEQLTELRDAVAGKVLQLETRLSASRNCLEVVTAGRTQSETTLAQLATKQAELRPRLMFRSDLPKDAMVSIMGRVGEVPVAADLAAVAIVVVCEVTHRDERLRFAQLSDVRRCWRTAAGHTLHRDTSVLRVMVY